jgi:hypothetical protein
METMPQRRALQLSIAIAALLPVMAGAWGIGTSGDGWASNHHRYLSGLLLAIGLGYWTALPKIETMGPRIRVLTALVVIGGVARLAGVALGDVPTIDVAMALTMELVVAPLLCLWQMRVFSLAKPRATAIAHLEPHLRHIAP